ncbi:MAG UNVERIFIED_CONTAM: hypothetical protein LVR29_28285 [Microcystis novacekii LVE1205-3]|jgi:hypothetical protein
MVLRGFGVFEAIRRLLSWWSFVQLRIAKAKINEIHRTIYELRKEVKSLKKTLGEKKEIESNN